jgi:hypothetical protein
MLHLVSVYYPYAIAILAVVLLDRWRRKNIARLPYPPGPKGLPIIGNLWDIPSENECVTYAKWSREYSMFSFSSSYIFSMCYTPPDSSVIHLNLTGTHLMIVNSADAAYELLEKRSAIYSDRVCHVPRVFFVCTSLIYVMS